MDKLDEAAFINKLYLPALSPSFMIVTMKNINIEMNILIFSECFIKALISWKCGRLKTLKKSFLFQMYQYFHLFLIQLYAYLLSLSTS